MYTASLQYTITVMQYITATLYITVSWYITTLPVHLYHVSAIVYQDNVVHKQWILKCVGARAAPAERLEPNEGWQHDSGEK